MLYFELAHLIVVPIILFCWYAFKRASMRRAKNKEGKYYQANPDAIRFSTVKYDDFDKDKTFKQVCFFAMMWVFYVSIIMVIIQSYAHDIFKYISVIALLVSGVRTIKEADD